MIKEFLYEGDMVTAEPMLDFHYDKMIGVSHDGSVHHGFHVCKETDNTKVSTWVEHDEFLRDAVEVKSCDEEVTPFDVVDALEFTIGQMQECDHFTTMKYILPLNGMIKEIKGELDKYEREQRAKREAAITAFIEKFTDDEEEADQLNEVLSDFL